MNTGKLLSTLVLFIFGACISSAQDAEATVVLDEKFDAFTNGTVDAPATADISTPSYSSELGKKLTGWRGSKVYEAGGALMIGDGGNLQTTYINTSTNGGNVRITVDVKARDSYGGLAKISFGYSFSETVMLTDDQWHTVSVITDRGSSSSYCKIEPSLSVSGIIIDNLKVETSEAFVAVPKANQPTTATSTYFYATWGRVTGATAYLLDVYTKNGDTKEYLLKDEEVTTTSRKVDGLEEGKTYYFTVRAKKGGYISEHSNEIEVVEVISGVDAPKALAATNITAGGFTANWEAVAKAAKYEVLLSKVEAVTETTDKRILDEDFSKVTRGTLTSIEFGDKLEEYLDASTKIPGWYGVNHCYAAGHMGIAPFGGSGSVTTPALDLSANNGAGTLTVNMAEGNFGTYHAGAEITISLFNGNEETAAETKTVTLEEGFKDYTVEFTKGTTESYIKVSYEGNKKLFIDYLYVTTTLSAGDKYTSLIETREVEGDKTSCDFTVALDKTTSYSYRVKAYVRTVVGGEIGMLASVASDAVEAKLTSTAINGVANADNGMTLRTVDGGIVITLDSEMPVSIYGIDGRLAGNFKGVKGANSVSLAKGAVIVRAGGKSYKVVVR